MLRLFTEVKETDAGTFEAIDRSKSLDVFIKLNDIDPTHGLVFTIDKPLQLKRPSTRVER